MALFKISKGKSENLPTNKVDGYCYVTTNDHKFYVDYTKDDGTLDRFALNAVSADIAQKLGTIDVGNSNKPIYLKGGTPKECVDFLPLSAGENNKLTGPLGLTENINYGASLPDDGFVGQLFLVEDEDGDNYLPLSAGENNKLTGPLGLTENMNYGTSLPDTGFNGQLFFVESESDGPSLPTGGTAGQVLVKNSSTDGDASWATDISGNAGTATKLATARTIQTNLASITASSFDGAANVTPGVTGVLGISNGGTGANNRKTAITNLGVFGLYDRNDIGISPNFDNPGVNGLFEMRVKAETTGESGLKPFDGFAPFISLHYSNTMFQLVGSNGSGFFVRGKQGADSTLTGTAWQKILTDANWSDYAAAKSHSHSYLPLSGGTMTGNLIINSNSPYLKTTGANGSIGLYVSTNRGIYDFANSKWMLAIDQASTKVYSEYPIYGAVWNDYAEFRTCNEDFKPGQVVCENNDDTLNISTYRLQPGANIVSDTYGFSIGETDEAKCPIAVSGRVLAYTYEPREEFNAGDAVCAGPNGTVSKMTREEIREYPERIIGTVSAVPDYEIWGSGNVPVNGRIWIKVK